MLSRRSLLIVACLFGIVGSVESADKPKRLLVVTHSAGFIHDSVGLAEDILKEIGPKHGFEVTCWRFTGDTNAKTKDGKPVLADYSEKFRQRTGKTVELENTGRINKETLKQFDCVVFFTTGNPVNKEELKDLMEWVREGGAFAGTHCATDTLYNTPYGELVGGYFDGHPWHQKIKLVIEDPKHSAAKGFLGNSLEITDEIYQFRSDPYYSREKLHIILSIDNSSIDVKKGKRADQDYAVSWCQEFGKGRSFYTSLGHRKEVWQDPRFQEHLMNGIKWTLRLVPGDGTPSGKKSAARIE